MELFGMKLEKSYNTSHSYIMKGKRGAEYRLHRQGNYDNLFYITDSHNCLRQIKGNGYVGIVNKSIFAGSYYDVAALVKKLEKMEFLNIAEHPLN